MPENFNNKIIRETISPKVENNILYKEERENKKNQLTFDEKVKKELETVDQYFDAITFIQKAKDLLYNKKLSIHMLRSKGEDELEELCNPCESWKIVAICIRMKEKEKLEKHKKEL